ncbi:hypothetical protein [Halorubrum yunnanense]|uniref:Sulfatase N-terminal domain-containing protein n=1 Tax=Halorubrum yunnanense TaxID=1526162 RepID=A0ABD5YHL6_9EURY|nr:hypothetical protein [Halorubrum yunnanense]
MPISAAGWLRESVRRVRVGGLRGVGNSLYDVYLGAALSVTSKYPLGTNLFSREWDALVVLDACRVDALQTVAPEYDFLQEVGSVRSVGSHSYEWMVKTFTERHGAEIGRTAYVSANPFTAREFFEDSVPPKDRTVPFGPREYGTVPRDAIGYVDEIRRYGVDDEYGFILPSRVTDRAIRAGREERTDRLLVHYMQPHDPFLVDGAVEEHIYGRLRAGELSRSQAWEWYLDALRMVLDEVAVLLDNLDADRVVITADHGEAFGEFGFYGHMPGFPHPAVRRVPWAETTATDTGERDVDEERTPDDSFSDLEEHLEDLGYR